MTKVTLTEWKPVFELLPLRGYYSDAPPNEGFMVCVNPTREFRQERADLLNEFSRRFAVYRSLDKKKTRSADEKAADDKAAQDFLDWSGGAFIPAMDGWFARLLSFGPDQYTADDIVEMRRVDEHLVNWLFVECIRMIEEHAGAKKKI